MFDLTQLFIGKAMAQAAATATVPAADSTANPTMASIFNFLPLLLIFAVFYVLIILPQKRKMDEQGKMIQALKRGDRVILSGGIYGKVSKLEDDTLTVEIADNVNVKVVRAQVQALAAKTDATATDQAAN